MLDLGDDTGGLVVYLPEEQRGRQIEINRGGSTHPSETFFASIVERRINGMLVHAAVFPKIPKGNYSVKMKAHPYKTETISVFSGEVAEVDWR